MLTITPARKYDVAITMISGFTHEYGACTGLEVESFSGKLNAGESIDLHQAFNVVDAEQIVIRASAVETVVIVETPGQDA